MNAYTPGPGDSATWPPYAGHPTDPRGPTGWDADAALEHYRQEFMALASDPKTGARFLSDELEEVNMDELVTRLFRDAAHELQRPVSLTERAATIGAQVFGLLRWYADNYARRRVADEHEKIECGREGPDD
ncbi:MAG: hypothetical protein HMLKMBBP_01521 [Planctomycetes bacterium]|nr:hypothetical protein [Planctomycetota bacterium]